MLFLLILCSEGQSAVAKMSCQRNSSGITVPDDLRDILLEFTISFLLEQPDDILDYGVEFFTRLRENRQNQLIQSGQTCTSTPDESVEEGNKIFLIQRNFFSMFKFYFYLKE